MAYAKDLQLTCRACKHKRATKEVFNQRNSSMGEFCSACAKQRVRELEREEKRNG